MNKPTARKEILIPVRRFRRVYNYMQKIGLDPDTALSEAGLNKTSFESLTDDDLLPVANYSRMYANSIKQMQLLRSPIPWAAGLGTDAFEMMCHSIISCTSLGDALQRAQKFDELLYPLMGYRVGLQLHEDHFELHYHVRAESAHDVFVPNEWEWAEHAETVAKVSGMTVWYRLCSWLVGHSLELSSFDIAGPSVSSSYGKAIQSIFCCPVTYDAEKTCIRAPLEYLSHRIVHHPESLAQFLENSVYELVVSADESRSTTSAIRSLVTRNLHEGMPSFEEMAETLHCSASSLRRRLNSEDTSYQDIKDQLRCEMALDLLSDKEMRVTTVAEMLGFSETSSFIRSFRNWMGMTPKEYKEQAAILAPESEKALPTDGLRGTVRQHF